MSTQPCNRHVLVMLWFIVSTIIISIQAVLGAEPVILVMAFLSVIVPGVIFYLFGIFNIASIFAVMLLMKYGAMPFIIKTLMGDRIDVGLWATNESFLIITVGSGLILMALFLANIIPIKNHFLTRKFHSHDLKKYGYVFYFLGLIFGLLHVQFKPIILASGQLSSGFGGFGEFSGFLYLGIILSTAFLVSLSNEKTIDVRIVLMLCGALLLSLLSNTKNQFVLSLIAYAATLFFYIPGYLRRKRGWRHLGYIFFLSIVFVYIVAPLVHITRAVGVSNVSTITERIKYVFDNSSNIMGAAEAVTLSRQDDRVHYFGVIDSVLVDRLDMIQDMDLVISRTNQANLVGWQPILLSFQSITPRFLYPDKPSYNDIDLIAYNIDLISEQRVLRRTMGVYAVAYSMFMWSGWIPTVLIIYVLWFIVLRVIVRSDLRCNVWAIYFLVKYGFVFTECGVQVLMGIMMRSIPLDIITILLVLRIFRSHNRSLKIDLLASGKTLNSEKL
ncbi:MAG: hypothetical protein GXP14_02575 [Gammaproteobacteria bacterium]|nr:hypothetical protein [Gammaproteobacteria bacterium]